MSELPYGKAQSLRGKAWQDYVRPIHDAWMQRWESEFSHLWVTIGNSTKLFPSTGNEYRCDKSKVKPYQYKHWGKDKVKP